MRIEQSESPYVEEPGVQLRLMNHIWLLDSAHISQERHSNPARNHTFHVQGKCVSSSALVSRRVDSL